MYHTRIKRQIRERGILHSAMLELTYKCNLDCYFCYNDTELQGKALGLEDYIRLFDDLARMQVMFITLTGGEPLVHPQFFEIAKAAKDRGFVMRIKTGGHCIAGRIARRLREEINPFQIQVSLHGATAETHEKQTQVKGSFEQLISNIAYMNELGLRSTFISTLTLWNEGEIEEMYQLADSLGVPLSFQGPVGPKDNGDTSPLAIQPTEIGWAELERVQEHRHQTGLEPYKVHEPPGDDEPKEAYSLYCGLGTEDIMIDPFGSVYPCMHVRRSAGNLHETNIRSIWGESRVFSDALKLNREAFIRKKANKDLSVLETPMFCPGLELRGCGSDKGGCRSGGCGTNVNRELQKGTLPNIRVV